MNRLLPLGLLSLFAATADAQSVLAHHVTPGDPLGYFGETAAFVGDANGDGISDYAVSADVHDEVYLFDGADSSILLVAGPSIPLNYFGHSIDGADFDGDGLADLAVASFSSSVIELVSGSSGALIASCTCPDRVVAVVGDVNGDGVPDVAGGKTGFAAWVRVCSGATGAPLYDLPTMDGANGQALVAPGDLDGDGVPDFVVGSPWVGLGEARARHGTTGLELWTTQGQFIGDGFGSALAALGDVNLDGVPDIAVCASFYNFQDDYVRILSGADGSMLGQIAPGPIVESNTALAGAGDVDGNGTPEVLIGRDSVVDMFDSATLTKLMTFDPDGSVEYLGLSLDAGPDLNGDGSPEFLATEINWNTSFTDGSVFLVSTIDLPWEHLENALPGTFKQPILRGEGAVIAPEPVELTLSLALPQSPVFLVVGAAPLMAPFKGGVLVPFPGVVSVLATDVEGQADLLGAWPAGLPGGTQLYYQVWFKDPAAVHHWAASNALMSQSP